MLLNRLSNQHGYLMFVAVIMIVIIGFLGIAVTEMYFSSAFSTANHYQSDAALYLAESGLEHATHKLLETTAANRLTCGGYNSSPLTNTLGNGSYSVTSLGTPIFSGHVIHSATLTAALSATTTTIPVSTTSYYASSGRIMIDSEYMNYASINGSNFLTVTRGVDSSVATTHALGTTVGQFECTLIATGTVPNATNPQGKRVLTQTVTLPEGWAVGDANSGNYTQGVFNYPNEGTWYNNPLTNGVSLYGVFVKSYADTWMVGANGQAIYWDGNTFIFMNLTPAVSYRSVFCTSFNFCVTVSDAYLSATNIENWNGSSWTKATISGTLPDTNLKSVYCDSASDCWAVGDNANALFEYFYQWNGSSWTAVTENTLSAYPYDGVFCNTSTDCWAVGANATFARKNGATWANYATGMPAVQYNSIFCNATNDCWAVGNASTTDLFVHWNGTAWSRNTSAPTPVANLTSVDCLNSNDCWAVGGTVSGNLPAFVHWDGTAWTQFTNISGGAFAASTLHSLSLVGPSTQPRSAWQETFS